jgi:hypothetical protein
MSPYAGRSRRRHVDETAADVRALDVAATTSAPISISSAIVQNCITPKNVN